MWNFQPPPHYTSIDTMDFRRENMPAVVKNHYFNHSVNLPIISFKIQLTRWYFKGKLIFSMCQISVVLPDTLTIPPSLHNCLSEDTDYYRINNLRVSDLLSVEFIEAFVKKGKFIINFLYILAYTSLWLITLTVNIYMFAYRKKIFFLS